MATAAITLCHECSSVKSSNSELRLLSCLTHSVCKDCFNSTEWKQKEDMFFCETCENSLPKEKKESIYVYMDNSNVWIEAKKLKGQPKGKEDRQIRVDVGKLLKIIAKDRIVAEAVLYGSEPPPIDTVWRSSEDKGWKVKVKERSTVTNKEKQVDTQLVVDATETICQASLEIKTIVFISGDSDIIPAIKKAKGKKCKVEVYMWEHAIASKLKNEPGISVDYLNAFKDQILFYSMKFPISTKPELLAQVRANGVVCKMEADAFGTKQRNPTNEWCKKIRGKFGNFRYFWMEEVNKTNKELVKNLLVLVFEIETNGSNKIADVLETKITKVLEKKTYLQYEQETKEQSNIDIILIYEFSSSEGTDEQDEHNIQTPPTAQDDQTNKVPAPIEEKIPTLNELNDTSNESPSSENEKEWELVEKKKRKRKQKEQQYSQQCEKRIYCQFGNHCKYKHTPKEKEYFDAHNGKGMKPIKSQLCKKEACPYVRNPEMCNYAHGESDGFCLKCLKKGHFITSCNTDS